MQTHMQGFHKVEDWCHCELPVAFPAVKQSKAELKIATPLTPAPLRAFEAQGAPWVSGLAMTC